MKSKSQNSSSGRSSNKPPLDVLVDSLLKEAAEDFEETPQLKWEWDHYLRLSGLIQKIREREGARDSQDVKQDPSGTSGAILDENMRRAAEIPEFVQWLRNNQVELDKISVGPVVDGLGLKTNVPLKSGELAFAVPKSIILSAEKARNSKLSVLIDRDPILHNMQNVLLAVFLLYEKYVNPESFWKPYVRIIPSTFDTIAYYTEEEMGLLKVNQRAFREALRMYKAIARQYAYFHTKFKTSTNPAAKGLKKYFTYNRYIWAVSAVSTRVNNWQNANDTLCMIPLLDLCNHGEGGVISTDYDDKAESFLCYAARDFDKETEFKMFYGHRSSIDFLIHNGFVPNSYKEDVYLLDLSLGTNTVNCGQKLAILKELNLGSRITFQLTPEQLPCARKLFAFINIFIAGEDQLAVYLGAKEEALVKMVDEPTLECLQYLQNRLELMRRVADNNLAATLRNICPAKVEEIPNSAGPASSKCSKVYTNLLQLLRNELKLLEMLVHSCKEFKCTIEKGFHKKPETPLVEGTSKNATA